MVTQREDTNLMAARILSLFLFRIPALSLLSRLIAPSTHLANVFLWGFMLPWAMLGVLSKLNK